MTRDGDDRKCHGQKITSPRRALTWVFEWQDIGGTPCRRCRQIQLWDKHNSRLTVITYEFGGTVDFVLAPEGDPPPLGDIRGLAGR